MRIRLYNARILSMLEKEEIYKGEVWVKDSVIERIIKYDSKNKDASENSSEFDEQIDCMGNLLMPGFKNCHAHGPMTFLRSYADDLPLQEWLNQKIFPAEAKLTKEDIYVLMQLAVLEYVRGGITTSFEMYFHPEMIAKACVDMGFRVTISGTVFGSEQPVDGAIETLMTDYNRLHKCHPLVDYKLGFHSEYSCCEALLKEIAALSRQLKEPVYMHNSETKREVAECIERYGKTPIQVMDSFGLFEYGGAGHHIVYADERDMQILKDKHIYVVTNPSSNLKLASGVAPLKEYMEHGILIAIGTDGPASNNSLNFFKEMYLAAGLQKLKYNDAAALEPIEVLRMACVNGARLLGLSECDSIAVGKQADLILIDLLKPNMQPMNHLVNNLVYSGSSDNVIMTMIAGNIVYVNGRYRMNVDPIRIYESANYIIRRIECSM
ncbi:MAG: amidohydrolase [Clostridiales bacterium]|nr:amidohydrolase [Clostridiales bacterium]